ncbi:ABC transporter substrate-binding protein [Streptomyces cyslabdanicus]|uniref:ABC transporter substrate-binding protein n=1 Tax=Streptomyces cyslabdanicus TaxID=1470456 RepID=UPI004043AC72
MMTIFVRTRRLGIASAALALVLLPTGCGGADSGTGDRKQTIALSGTINTLDPVLSTQIQNDTPSGMMYDTLIDYDAKSKVTPYLAESWKVSPDVRSLHFTLRQGVTFHDGTPVTADDVVYTLNRVKALGIGVASLTSSYASSTAIDSHNVEIKLSRPDSSFLGALSRVYILNSKLVKQHEGSDHAQAWLASHEAGSGAYALTSFKPGSSIETSRYAKYFDFKASRPEHFVLPNSEESSSIRDMLLSGDLDVGVTMSPADVEPFRKNSLYKVVELPFAAQSYLVFNNKSPVLSDRRVREAITLSYDYKGALSSILRGNGKIATGVVPSFFSCHAEFPTPAQDQGRAKKLLKEAGASGRTFNLVYPEGLSELKAQATLLQSNLRDVGLTVSLRSVTFAAYLGMLSKPQTTPDMALVWDAPLYPDPGQMLYSKFDSKFVGTGANYSQYSNPRVDKLLTQALSDPSESDRCNLYKQAETIIHDDYAIAPLLNGTNLVVTRADISGVTFSPIHPSVNPLYLKVG